MMVEPPTADRRTLLRRNAIIGVLAERGPLTLVAICLAAPIDLRRLAVAEADLDELERAGRVVVAVGFPPTVVSWDEPTAPALARMWRLPTDAERRAMRTPPPTA